MLGRCKRMALDVKNVVLLLNFVTGFQHSVLTLDGRCGTMPIRLLGRFSVCLFAISVNYFS